MSERVDSLIYSQSVSWCEKGKYNAEQRVTVMNMVQYDVICKV